MLYQCLAEDKDLDAYKAADLAMALCRMVSYNIAQLAYLNAKREGVNRIFFGGEHHVSIKTHTSDGCLTAHGVPHLRPAHAGFFIRGHPYTMETISFAIEFWSKVISFKYLMGAGHHICPMRQNEN
jgi:bifunctional damage-control phosphatase, subfamily II, fusion protein